MYGMWGLCVRLQHTVISMRYYLIIPLSNEVTWRWTRSLGTQQDQIMPPLQRSSAFAPEKTQLRLSPHSYCCPPYQQ